MKGWLAGLRVTWAYQRLPALLRVQHALLAGEEYALEISQKYRLWTGTTYALLARLEELGMVESSSVASPVPGRRIYRLTARGQRWLRRAREGWGIYPCEEWDTLTALRIREMA